MFNSLRILTPPDDPTLSLQVRARLPEKELRKKSQVELLLNHFLQTFLNNEVLSPDGEARTLSIQILCAIALPGLVFALFLFPPYHFPGGRPYWFQVSDQYFYVMYAFVVGGLGTIFEWEVFFPSVADVFVFSSLPSTHRNLFLSRISAVALFLGLFILGTNLLGIVFFPAVCDLPIGPIHFVAHFAAVMMSGIFAAAMILCLESLLLILFPARLVQMIAPVVQGFYVTALFTILLLFPTFSRSLTAMMQSASRGVRCFPPFWFLGMYRCILNGSRALPVFSELARIGLWMTISTLFAAVLLFPVAYWRRTQQLVEGRAPRASSSRLSAALHAPLHATILENPQRRAIHHFISQTLFRTQRHRVYLALYGGLGVALVLSSALLVRSGAGEIRLQVSATGLIATLPILIFWVIVGQRAAFLSAVDQRASWIFRVIGGRPSVDQLEASRAWTLLSALLLAGILLAAIHFVAPPALRGRASITAQLVVAAGLCLLLRDLFFLNVKIIPFTQVNLVHKTNVAFILIQYLGLFPPLTLITLGAEAWMELSVRNIFIAVVVIASLHLALREAQRRIAKRNSLLVDIDEDEDEFPRRLGLRY